MVSTLLGSWSADLAGISHAPLWKAINYVVARYIVLGFLPDDDDDAAAADDDDVCGRGCFTGNFNVWLYSLPLNLVMRLLFNISYVFYFHLNTYLHLLNMTIDWWCLCEAQVKLFMLLFPQNAIANSSAFRNHHGGKYIKVKQDDIRL